MGVEVRRCRDEEEMLAALRTVESAFGEGPNEWYMEYAKKTMPVDRALVALDRGKIVGSAGAFPFSLTIPGGGELACGGVTWVGVLPTHRRRGVLRAMMRFQLDDLHERGEPLAALYASESLIYGRFGYGIAAPAFGLEASKTNFAFREDPGPVGGLRVVTFDEALELIPPVYERVRVQRAGMIARTREWWEGRLKGGDPPPGAGPRFSVVFERDGRVEGYALYRMRLKWEDGDPQGTVLVVEAMGENPVALREVWRFLFSIDLTQRVEVGYADPGSGLWLGVEDPRRLHAALFDGLWLRLLDVDAALRARSYANDDPLVLEVRDEFCAWNDGQYRLGGGRVDAEADLALTARDLASVYLGGVGMFALAAAGRVDERTSGAVARADAAFRTALPPFCPEEF
jgi:predicted acetyltransferase